MHVGDDETARHNSASEMRDTRLFPIPLSCASPMRTYRVVDRLYPTPCVGLNTLRISDAKMPHEDGRIGDAIWPHELDASEMRKA